MIKFLHISDVHLNKTFATKDPELRIKLQRQLRRSFQNAVKHAIDHDLDALVIAGDLFDHTELSFQDVSFINEMFEKLMHHQIKVLYASGNHDHTAFDSPIRKVEFPENVITFFDDQAKSVSIESKDGHEYTVVGCGHMLVEEHRDLIATFPFGADLGIAHSMVASRLTKGDEGQYLPSSIETIEGRQCKYFALGHVHSGGPIDKNERIYYAGVLQGLNRNETGLKGGYEVKLHEEDLVVKFVPLAAMTYEKLTMNISQVVTMDQLYDHVMRQLRERDTNCVLSLTFEGNSNLYGKLKDQKNCQDMASYILERLDFIDLIIKNDTRPHFDAEDYIDKKSVLGEVLRYTRTLRSGELPELNYLSSERATLREALETTLEDEILNYFLEEEDEN